MPKYQDKNGKWVIQYKVGYDCKPDPENPGKMKKRIKYKSETVGKLARVANSLLRQREAEWEAKMVEGSIESSAHVNSYTLEELIQWYLALPVTQNKRSYSKDVERSPYLLNYFGDIKANKIKPSMVESFQHDMLKTKSKHGRPFKPSTVNRMVALMKRIFNLALREDMVLKNPCWKVTMLKENNQRDRVISFEQYELLQEQLESHLKPIVAVGYFTGMRLGEILGLTWKQVNMEQGYIDLEPEQTKTSEPRRVYFTEELCQVLERVAKVKGLRHRFVFTYKGKPITSFRRTFRSACQRAGIQDFRFHDLRHTFNTNMRKAGVDQTVIMKLTGHKTPAMFNRYNTVDQQDAKQAMERFNDLLAEQKNEKSSEHVQKG